MDKSYLIAHRGASTLAPENTKESFLKAWECGADGIEGDFRLTADGEIVCIHDADTFRVSDTRYVIANASLTELRTVDIGSWYDSSFAETRILTFSEVMGLVPVHKKLFVEVKVGCDLLAPLLKQIKAGPLDPAQVKVISFQDEVIASFKRDCPEVDAFWIVDLNKTCFSQEEILDRLKRVSADGLSLNYINIEQSLIKNIIDAGYPVHVWAVDDPIEVQKFLQWGVASVTSNQPREIQSLF